MKILKIRLCNLNSLKGEHQVDFEKEPLSHGGLFAITGPTGAGKSTVLDAVTLALYGQIARYGTKPNAADIITRSQSDAWAEVEFEVARGRFRAHWSVATTRTGNVSTPKRHVYDSRGIAIAEQIRTCNDKIEELVGLDYGRFLRSVLLAQGDFAKFLHTDGNERAELLEKLTGTEIYARIASRVAEILSEKHGETEALRHELKGIGMMPDEERTALESIIQKLTADRETLRSDLKDGLTVRQNIEKHRQEMQKMKEAGDKKVAAQKEMDDRKKDVERLELHQRARRHLDPYKAFENAKVRQEDGRKKWSDAKVVMEDALKARVLGEAVYRGALESEHRKSIGELKDLTVTIGEQQKKVEKIEKWLGEHRQDQALKDKFTDLGSAIDRLKDLRRSVDSQWNSLRELLDGVDASTLNNLPLNAAKINVGQFEASIDQISGDFKTAWEKHKETVAEYTNTFEGLQLSLKYIDDLESLTAGEPCPLCGSTEHPDKGRHADGRTSLEEGIASAKDKLGVAREHARLYRDAPEKLSNLWGNMKQGMVDVSREVDALSTQLETFEIQGPDWGAEDEFCKKLLERRDQYQTGELKLSETRNELLRRQDSGPVLKERIVKLTTELEELGEPGPDGSDVPDILPDLESARSEFQKKKSNHLAAQGVCKEREEDFKNFSTSFSQAVEILDDAINGSEFPDIPSLAAAFLENDEAEKLLAWRDALQEQVKSANIRIGDSRKEIEKLEEQKTPTGEAADEALKKYKGFEEKEKSVNETLISGKTNLKTDDDNRGRASGLQKKIGKIEDGLGIWEKLKRLTGDQQGKAFRRFAQQISLDTLLKHANDSLKNLCARYQLRSMGENAGENEKLEIEIIDLHQGHNHRPVKSLSGGETFLVSLALALGLSLMSSQRVRFETLFIDEGFGSLDSDCLDNALDSLEQLRQDGKTIGVISHVDLLKQRISMQVEVEKRPGGFGRVLDARLVSG
ncbi:MAG: AAA family ATPase [Opitutae bacterium]|nr:AAA family ATPase [Opitutae bacterium]